MREIATTLTDYLLAAVSFLAALRLFAQPGNRVGPVLFFGGFALATLIGGTWHGFFSTPGTPAQDSVWWLSMLFAGLSSVGLAATGVELLGYRNRPALLTASALLLAAFGFYVWQDPRFLASLIASVCGTLACIAGLLRQLGTANARAASMALAALGISVLAALAQQRGIALHPPHFDHNATYHIILLPALGLFYAAFRRITL